MQSGDQCPKCQSGQMHVRTSKPCGGGAYQARYFRCTDCGHEEKSVVESARIMRRQKRGKQPLAMASAY
jgi:hypothetical protein